jgi:ketosteroid isomerase-like protein
VSDPEERAEWLRGAFDAWDAGDVEAVLERFDPQIEVFAAEGMINSGTYRGHDAFLRWAGQWYEAWEGFRNEIQEVTPVGERHAVVRSHQSGRGRESGVQVAMDVGWVAEEQDGLVTYLALHPEYDEAVRDAREREGLTGD